MNNLIQVVHAGLDTSMYRLSRGMRVKELPTSWIGIIVRVAACATHIIVNLIGHIIQLLEELQGTQSLKL